MVDGQYTTVCFSELKFIQLQIHSFVCIIIAMPLKECKIDND